MRLTDAHHHIWRRADLPWLLGPPRARIFGAYEPLKRDYTIADYQADIAGSGVEASVYVQANWAPNWFLDEVRYVAQAHEAAGMPNAIVAFCDMTAEDARLDLDRLAAFPLVRGVRHQMHWHPNPAYRFASRPDLVCSERVIRNVGALSAYDFVFELQVFEQQVDAALMLIDACPDVTFVLQHALMWQDTTPDGFAAWRDALRRLARCRNVVCKVSGLGTFLHRVDPAHVATVTVEALAAFGPERCLFGSNFPIERIWGDFPALVAAHRDAAGDLDKAAQKALFRQTAARVYRL